MRRIKNLSFSIAVGCLVLYLSPGLSGEEENGVAAPMKTTEQKALYSAIQGFVGNWWNGSDLYPDPCGWTPIQGVSCDLFDGFWYVIDLSIGPVHDNSLSCAETVEFAHQLFELKRLRTLSLSNCFVWHPVSIPSQKWEVLAANLESLEFRSNPGLTGSVPAAFGELTNLQSLVLVENGLTGELPDSLGNLIKLRRLNLAGNEFTGPILDSFGGLNHLLILDISKNSLSGSMPDSLGELNSLLKLDLSHNQLQGQIPNQIGNLKNLTLLDLSSNRLSGEVPESLQQMNSLQELALSNNPIGGGITAIDWQSLRGLTALDLSNMSLTCSIPESIATLQGLRFLGLSDNRFTGGIPPMLASLPNVSAVYIHGNNLTGQLQFPEEFYRRMGRRFGAWDNPNLCYPMSTRNAPFGVKLCQQKVMRYGTDQVDWNSSMVGNGGWVESRACLGCRFSGLLIFIVGVLVCSGFQLKIKPH